MNANRVMKNGKHGTHRSHTGEALAPMLAAGPLEERPAFDFAAATEQQENDLDITEVGRDAKMPWCNAADYVDKILNGAKPAELPVSQATKFNLTVNLKTAKALGITFPPSILLRANRVIE